MQDLWQKAKVLGLPELVKRVREELEGMMRNANALRC